MVKNLKIFNPVTEPEPIHKMPLSKFVENIQSPRFATPGGDTPNQEVFLIRKKTHGTPKGDSDAVKKLKEHDLKQKEVEIE
jgi:hypothetical protein